jgi:glycosyl transferase family 25
MPPIHLINLDRSTERLRRFQERNRHLENVVRVSAVDGAALARSDLVGAGYIAGDLICGPGTLGCAMSHFKLWEKAVQENRALTILEDDAVVAHHFALAATLVMSELPPDWDFIKWGWTLNLFAWLDLGVSRVKLLPYGEAASRDAADLHSFQVRAVPVTPVRMLHSFGLFGYSISPKGARAALGFCLPLRKRAIEFPVAGVALEAIGIDATLCGAYPDMQAFMCLPQLVVHADEGDYVRVKMDRVGA